MNRATVLKLQQIEFFLLYSLVVDELQLIKRSKRMTPAYRARASAQQREVLIGRLFRSFLEKVFRRNIRISKRPYFQEFTVEFDADTCDRLRNAQATHHDLCRTLQPTVEEIGFLRFNSPQSLTVTIMTGNKHRYNYRYGYEIGVADMGIGRYCPAVKAVMAWRDRLDTALAALDAAEMVGPPEPKRNQAQEQLDAVLKDAAKTGRL